MGLFSWFLRLFGWKAASEDSRRPLPVDDRQIQKPNHAPDLKTQTRRLTRTKLVITRCKNQKPRNRKRTVAYIEAKGSVPYRYARYGSQTDHYLDLSRDGDASRLNRFGLPVFHTPEQLADWIGLPLNKVAWLIHRFSAGRPASVKDAHYCFYWVRKRLGGWRLIESPKSTLKLAQSKILHDLLDKVPGHDSAHGFASGRSILTNSVPHLGQPVLLKLDLENFYTTVGFPRVVAIFRSMGYSREVAIWLGLLTTSAVPANLGFQEQGPYALLPYLKRHLPQGAPTSPALANLSAFGLDLRLAGLAKTFDVNYTRYADDLTFSGSQQFSSSLRTFVPLIRQIIRQERFALNRSKTRILRSHQRQIVTGVVVNEKPNVTRKEFDQLKAILTNCVRHGPSTQNRYLEDSFFHHLQGRIAHINMLNCDRGRRLNDLFLKIDWSK